ncbi:D-TA family PLP-dependent enzyme [Muriicola sp. Z0-33]|uniref:D-TA family PLP-dependent enzyme n=1 Tax=Muriicola sp. Z0-33 TaxID=2816957 RepID=UPI0022386E1C|nr:D-TA family PLP-dependent enzyme [Muriicola sp. Z0-33]MCW5515055.1 D-TA family PLP-dependent enzyme [Muriicola sp. Z0-33]
MRNWYSLKNTEDLVSPALLVYPDRIEKNIRKMIEMAEGTDFLRPHVKTHKTAEIIQMQMAHGIHKFKCATIPEAQLLGKCGAKDILLAMQPVGANIGRFFDLITAYPKSEFSTIVDNLKSISAISEMAEKRDLEAALYLDLNTGMNRTGIAPGETAITLFKTITLHPKLKSKGLHAYDGHLRHTEPATQKTTCDAAFNGVLKLKEALKSEGFMVENIVAGGSPTFPIHAKRPGVEASPGTTLLWDNGYGTLFPDMGFVTAAVLFTRIISKPGPSLICLDLGHKAIAPEMPFPRVRIFGLEHCGQTAQSEEHLVVNCPENNNLEVGDAYYAIPQHICPTVAKYNELLTVEDREITGSWQVAARDH